MLRFERARVADVLARIQRIAVGESTEPLPVSPARDELDALAYAINVMSDELHWSTARVREVQTARADELRQELAEADRTAVAKGIFLRNLSHEIRTPIAAMVGFAELLCADGISSEERREIAARLKINGDAVVALLGDLLDLARLDADRVKLALEPVSLLELAREVMASFEVEARARQVTLELSLAEDATGPIRSDRLRLRQILVNLVGNAIKFTRDGRVTIALSADRPDASRRIIDVTDTGIGIAADRRARLFEPFEQADPSIAPKYGGSGIGLALSRRLAERLGGRLDLLHSAPGHGSTFRLTLVSLTTAASELPARPNDEEDAGALRGLRILLAEDHPDLRMAVRRLLERSGASVDTAGDGKEAVTKALGEQFDVLLMDLRMPELNGLQATRALRTAGCRARIVALTADPAAAQRASALDAGCDGVLGKPFTMSELLATIQLPGAAADAGFPAPLTLPRPPG
jgi:signal transduction histidine kinase/ActR/RegA family two-component response regulator